MAAPLADYLEQQPRHRTRMVYRSHLLAYLAAVAGFARAGRSATPEEFAHAERIAAAYLADCDPVADLRAFVRTLASTPPKTAQLRFTITVDWLMFHGRELSARDRKAIAARLPKGGAQTVDADLDREALASILHHMDARARAAALVLVSSGMRIGELLKVPLRDVNLGATPAEILLRGSITKNGAPRITFISAEAVTAVREWLAVRDATVARAVGRHDALARAGRAPPKQRADPRLFPFSASTVRNAWDLAVAKAGYREADPTTGRATVHIHMLRKYFLSQGKLGAPAEVIEELAGHAGYLSSAYRRYTKAQLAEYYVQAEPYLTVLVPGEYLAMKGQVAERLSAHSEILEGVMKENLRRAAELERVQSQIATLRELLDPDRLAAAAREIGTSDESDT